MRRGSPRLATDPPIARGGTGARAHASPAVGAYGIVWKAVEKRSHNVVALKKCFDAFRNSTDAQRTFREIMYLQKLSGHENIIRLQHIIKAENDRDIYLTFDHMETDLHAVIRAAILEDIHKKYIIYQLLKALKYMHSGDLLHRDIKPSNLLLNSDCHVKLCDFGLCRSVAEVEGPSPVLTDYVATRWYRAPELLVGDQQYGLGVDTWAIGCMLVEIQTGVPIFPGESDLDQLWLIMKTLGKLSEGHVECIRRNPLLSQGVRWPQPGELIGCWPSARHPFRAGAPNRGLHLCPPQFP